MTPETKALLLKFEHMVWFCSAGSSFHSGVNVLRVEDWPSAIEICCSEISSDARLEANNELTVELAISHKQAYRSWNVKVAELKPQIERLVERKLAASPMRSNIADDVVRSVVGSLRWDLLALCMASEYNDLFSTKYYEALKLWYLAGHFPCGWIGEVPEDMEDAFSVDKLAVI